MAPQPKGCACPVVLMQSVRLPRERVTGRSWRWSLVVGAASGRKGLPRPRTAPPGWALTGSTRVFGTGVACRPRLGAAVFYGGFVLRVPEPGPWPPP